MLTPEIAFLNLKAPQKIKVQRRQGSLTFEDSKNVLLNCVCTQDVNC